MQFPASKKNISIYPKQIDFSIIITEHSIKINIRLSVLPDENCYGLGNGTYFTADGVPGAGKLL